MKLGGFLARRNLRADRFATACMILGVALGTATVCTVLALDDNTRRVEQYRWNTNPELVVGASDTVRLVPLPRDGRTIVVKDAATDTHEDYQVMRSAIRLGSLSAFLVGALIVFFSLAVVIERRKREVALLRSLGATAPQVAGVFVREALVVGLVGAIVGFLLAFPMTLAAARLGITTTGRARIGWIDFPIRAMLLVSSIGGLTALLGVIPPARAILKLSVPETLRPRFLDGEAGRDFSRRTSGITLIVVPFMVLLYVLIRPFFREILPSLAFFVIEAGLVTTALLLLLVLVPDLTRVVGGLLGRVFLRGPAAARLLTQRRIEHQGHELAWSVGGIMLVFALLLSLHVSTHALKQEVTRYGAVALRGFGFVYTHKNRPVDRDLIAALPREVAIARYSSRTPVPNSVSAVAAEELRALAAATREPELIALAARFGPDSVILSPFMARRLGIIEGDHLRIESPTGTRTLEVVGVSDRVGFIPMLGTYRATKTYAVVEAASYPVLKPYAEPMGAALVLADPNATAEAPRDWPALFAGLEKPWWVTTESGVDYETARVRETDRDFFIFDIILGLTTLLAAVGIANQLVLAVHGRRREIALLRVLGMTALQIRKMLLLEGAFVGLLGGTLAVMLGVPLGLGSLAALQLVSTFDVRFELPPHYAVLTVVGAVVVAVLAALYPARQAANARSAESVHYE